MPPPKGYKQTPEHIAARFAAQRATDTPTEKRCPRCTFVKPAADFGVRKSNPRWLRSMCRSCVNEEGRERNRRNPERLRRNNELMAFRRLGTTEEEYLGLLARQDGRCAICGTATNGNKKRLAVDHCHATGRIRGLLCGPCNTGIGMLRDSPELLGLAAEYVRHHQG